MINVGLFGATGYAGFETLKILKNHPHTRLKFATSETYQGQLYSEVYPVPWDITLVSGEGADLSGADAVICCLPHAASIPTVRRARDAGVRVVDLSADFRLKDVATYEKWYAVEHTAPELIADAVYGLAEVNRVAIQEADLLAVPGCYPTSILLALYPLLKEKLLNPTMPLIADSKSGVSGAGRKLSLKTHFVEANENLSPYNIGQKHRHSAEIQETLAGWGGGQIPFIFSPHLVPISRGMLSTVYASLSQDMTAGAAQTLFADTYEGQPLVRVLPPGQLATFAHTQRNNSCALSVTLVNERQLIICSSIDNLGKGAAGQAVQDFNIMFGLEETAGLV